MSRLRTCLLGQAHTRERPGWSTPVNDSREWMRVLDFGDVLNYQRVIAQPEILRDYDLAIVELTPVTHRLPALIKKAAPDLLCIGLIEGRVEYVVRSNQEMEGLFDFYQNLDTLDLVGVLVERTVPYYRLYVQRPERIQWLGIPYPKDWTDRVTRPRQPQHELIIELGSAMDSRNGIANLLILQAIQKRFPQVVGRIFYYSPRELQIIKAFGLRAQYLRPRSWPHYYRGLQDAFAILCMDDRRTWGRYALDCASARIPYVGSNLSHCGEVVGVMTGDPFDTQRMIEHLSLLLEEHAKGTDALYREVSNSQYAKLKDYDGPRSRERLRRALLAAGYEDIANRLAARKHHEKHTIG